MPKRVLHFWEDIVPSLMVAVWFTFRTFTGTVLPVEYEWAWQASAAVVGVLCWVTIFVPWKRGVTRLAAGITAVTWLMVWSGMLISAIIKQTGLGQRISWIGIWQYLMFAVFIAYLFGKPPHPWPRPTR